MFNLLGYAVFMHELRSHWRTDQPNVMLRLERAIKKAGSQAAFARKLGMSRTFINRVVKGHSQPTPSILFELGFTRETTIKEQR